MAHTKEEKIAAFARLLDVQERLRKDCPWDRKQTYESLRPNTVEEVMELCDALLKGDEKEVMKELGDMMEHVVFYAMIGQENQTFDIADVCNQQTDKLMFRHDFINWNEGGTWTVSRPDMHINAQGQVVYNDAEPATTDADTADGKPQTATQVASSWEKRKQMERDGNKSVLSGVPRSLPSIIKAYRIQDKARNVGFDWEDRDQVWSKVREELDELEAELKKGDKEKATRELGDYMFSLINAARLYHLNPDNALEHTNQKFIRRFGYVEQQAKAQGKLIGDLTLAEMDALWNEAKKQEL